MKYPRLVSMPSAVSNWLEEQLEALGIDSAIYTRYILSLLHADVLDVIYPEDDYFLTKLKKEGNRKKLNNKRFRRAKSWRRNIDADQIKRSAAVECLMSAAEQSCEIESLVDQLCEKLKEVNANTEGSDLISDNDLSATIDKSMNKTVSPKELAEKYYAAFPALNQKSEPSYISSNINFVLDKWPSDKTRTNLITAKWITPDLPKKSKRKPVAIMDNYNPIKHDVKRNNFGHKRTYCGRNLTKEMADNFNNWQRLCWYYDSNTMAEGNSNFNEKTDPVFTEENDDSKRRRVSNPPSNEDDTLVPTSTYKPSSFEEFDDEETAIKEEYFPSFPGDKIDMKKKDGDNCELDHESVAVSVANYVLKEKQAVPPSFEAEYLWGGLLMVPNHLPFYRRPFNLVPMWSTDNADDKFKKLNHKKGFSAFAEYRRPTSLKNIKEDNPLHPGFYLPNFDSPPPPAKSVVDGAESPIEMYFKPVRVDAEPSREATPEDSSNNYMDGATFQVNSDWEKIKYKELQDGCLWIDIPDGEAKAYRQFKEFGVSSTNEFTVKYAIEKTDQICQTGEYSFKKENLLLATVRPLSYLGDFTNSGNLAGPYEEAYNLDLEGVPTDEVVWSCTPKSSNVFCKHCNNRHPWPGNLPNELNVASNERSLKDIWGGSDMCGACPWSTKPPTPLDETSSKLREESREEAEKLLSHLNNLHLSKVRDSVPFQQPINRRHSQGTTNLVSFASLLQEDLLGSVPTLPARQPVLL